MIGGLVVVFVVFGAHSSGKVLNIEIIEACN